MQKRASHTTCIRSTNIVSVLYLRSVRFGRIEFVEGSRRSRVDGSGTSRRRSRVVVEVDVHGRRGSSGTRSFFGEVLDESNIFGATVVVHGRRGTCRSGLGVDVQGKRSGTKRRSWRDLPKSTEPVCLFRRRSCWRGYLVNPPSRTRVIVVLGKIHGGGLGVQRTTAQESKAWPKVRLQRPWA